MTMRMHLKKTLPLFNLLRSDLLLMVLKSFLNYYSGNVLNNKNKLLSLVTHQGVLFIQKYELPPSPNKVK